MKAMQIHRIAALADHQEPLIATVLPVPEPGRGELRLRVSVCGVCHTELDECEGRTAPASLPMTPGHQVVGVVEKLGPGSHRFEIGERLGVAWIHSVCGQCQWCGNDQENLCPDFIACGRDAPGGYAEFMTVPEAFAYSIPPVFSDAEAAPLLCAGAVGYRSLRLCHLENGQILGLTGFGASAHLVLQTARHLYPQSCVFVFARNPQEREYALELGAEWAGDTCDKPPQKVNAIIDTTPAWLPIVAALDNLEAGGRLVVNAIRKESTDIGQLTGIDYGRHLWMEKQLQSVANVSRRDVAEFLEIAASIPIKPKIEIYALEDANRALIEMQSKPIRGAKVLQIGS